MCAQSFADTSSTATASSTTGRRSNSGQGGGTSPGNATQWHDTRGSGEWSALQGSMTPFEWCTYTGVGGGGSSEAACCGKYYEAARCASGSSSSSSASSTSSSSGRSNTCVENTDCTGGNVCVPKFADGQKGCYPPGSDSDSEWTCDKGDRDDCRTGYVCVALANGVDRRGVTRTDNGGECKAMTGCKTDADCGSESGKPLCVPDASVAGAKLCAAKRTTTAPDNTCDVTATTSQCDGASTCQRDPARGEYYAGTCR